ncbi:enoyl-CoA hydratase/isomerase family protein [Mycobacterium xenopi 4042]|uniref:Enoyl-CoA hydratase/isomerase family protein n=1 Tax=Mycobacterium xenopi 4042 TaxID=1299334 RepID=X8AHE1_MYCXE|nr:enoyl-CoA hydratase/isomerase family protein [Mycobacterium xenopi 4042]
MVDAQRPAPEEIILYAKDAETKIATITFNRPEFLNAPTAAARLRYADLLRGVTVDDDVKVVVIRGVGDDFGSGADLPEFMEGQDSPEFRLAELRLENQGIRYPPKGSFRHGATISAWYANSQAGNRPLQELKKISIVEAKGYCYGWHFYQAADADLVISSDDALFGHPSFRYYGWGPGCGRGSRLWGCASSRKWCSLADRSPPMRCTSATSLTRWCHGISWKPKCRSTRWHVRVIDQPTRFSCKRCSSKWSSNIRVSTWAACCLRSSSRWAATFTMTSTTWKWGGD